MASSNLEPSKKDPTTIHTKAWLPCECLLRNQSQVLCQVLDLHALGLAYRPPGEAGARFVFKHEEAEA